MGRNPSRSEAVGAPMPEGARLDGSGTAWRNPRISPVGKTSVWMLRSDGPPETLLSGHQRALSSSQASA